VQDYKPRTPEQLMLDFWGMAEAHTMKRWGQQLNAAGGEAFIQEALGIANNDTIKLALEFHAWCDDVGENRNSTVLFMVLLFRRIEWHILEFFKSKHAAQLSLEAATGDDPGEVRNEDLVRTQLSRHRPASMLHRDIAEYIGTLRWEHQLMLALFFFEELKAKEIKAMFDIPAHTFSQATTYTTARVLNFALNQVSTVHVAPPDTYNVLTLDPHHPPLIDWIHDHYGTRDIHAYLAYVRAHYGADVSYLVDILRRGNGERVLHKYDPDLVAKRVHRYKVDNEQAVEVLRRLAEGESGRSIAISLGVTPPTIYKIRDGKRTARNAA
jgi:hypothetical protein